MPFPFLKQLLHARLPVRVTHPEDIRCVSVLLATGLIEAEIRALKSTARYANADAATVVRITEAGLAELIGMSDARVGEEGTG